MAAQYAGQVRPAIFTQRLTCACWHALTHMITPSTKHDAQFVAYNENLDNNNNNNTNNNNNDGANIHAVPGPASS